MAKADEARQKQQPSMDDNPEPGIRITDPKDLETCSFCGQNREPTFRSPTFGWICCHREVCRERQGRLKIDGNALYEKVDCPMTSMGSMGPGEHAPLPYEKVDHPKHYNEHPAGIECVDVVEEMSFNLGNAVKYIWRAGLKPDSKNDEDLAKAEWYLKRERERLAKRPKT